jgi:hypothetical protein
MENQGVRFCTDLPVSDDYAHIGVSFPGNCPFVQPARSSDFFDQRDAITSEQSGRD